MPRRTTITYNPITYAFGGQTVATRIINGSSTLYYIYNDHLGSNSRMSTSAGSAVADSIARYTPFGDWRTEPTDGLTDRGYTSHLHNNLGSGSDDLGLIYMNARYYLPSLNRFISADTIVPNPANPQSFNRYSYAYNNPVNYSDPSGHNPAWCNDPYDAGGGANCASLVDFDVADGAAVSWTFDEMLEVMHGAALIDFALMRHGSGFLKVYGGTVTFEKTGKTAWNLGEATSKNHILVNEHSIVDITGETTGAMWATHELGHAFNYALSPNTTDDLSYGQGIIDLALEGVFADVNGDGLPDRIAGNTTQSYANDNSYVRTSFGYRPGLYSENGGPYQQNTANAVGEDYADMFMNWTFNSFAANTAGEARYNFMNNHMSAWISLAVANNQ